MLAIFPSGTTTGGRRGPVRLRARTATGLKGPIAPVCLALSSFRTRRARRHFVSRSPPKRERTKPINAARFLSLILVITNVQSSTQTCSANFIPVPASGSCPARPVPAGPRGTAAAPAHRAQDRVCSAWRTRLVTHARTPRSRAPLSSTRFPLTRSGVVRAVHARPRGPTRLTKDAAVLAVRTKAQ